MLVPHYKVVNKDISTRIGFRAHSLMLPIGEGENNSVVQKKVWILRDIDDYVWYMGERLTPDKDQVVEIDPAASEAELWDRDNPDYYHDLSMAFSLLIHIPYHSIRTAMINLEGNDIAVFEISYRHEPNGITYTEVGRFLSVVIVNAFLECNPDRLMSQSDIPESDALVNAVIP